MIISVDEGKWGERRQEKDTIHFLHPLPRHLGWVIGGDGKLS